MTWQLPNNFKPIYSRRATSTISIHFDEGMVGMKITCGYTHVIISEVIYITIED